MTRLNSYLLNEGRSKALTQEQADKLIKANCNDILKQYKKNQAYIYRGVNMGGGCFIVNPTKGEPRRSKDAGPNFYTLLMDNLPNWKSYPKRSRSIVCSTTVSNASAYGKVFVVFPFNNAKIGIAPTSDIWISFQNSPIGNLPVFQRNLINLLNATFTVLRHDADWKTLTNSFKHSEQWIKNNIDLFNSITLKYNWVNSDWYKQLQNKSYIELLNKYMNPKKNNFKLETPKTINLNSLINSEIWIGNTQSITIDIDLFNEKMLHLVL